MTAMFHDIQKDEIPDEIERLRGEMTQAAKRLDFETAAQLRDRIKDLEARLLGI